MKGKRLVWRLLDRAILAERFVYAYTLFGLMLASYLAFYARVRFRHLDPRGKSAERVHALNAERALRAILHLQGVYVKLGQVLSVLGGILPGAYVKRLSVLQDAVPPRPYPTIARRFVEEFGAEPREILAEFHETPEASASLGQVHRAVTKDGRTVAVKVQYPRIEKIVEMDLKLLGRVTRVLDFFFPEIHYHRVHEQMVDVVRRELDYLSEARSLERVRGNFEGEPDYLFPRVLWEHTTPKVLTTEFMHGFKIWDRKGLRAAGIDARAVVRLLVNAYYKQILIDGVLHADPHPGNFLVQPGPKIVFLDFGAVVDVDPSLKAGIKQVLLGYMSRDDRLVMEGVETMGFRSLTGDRALFERSIRHYFEKVLRLSPENLSRIDMDVIRDFTDFRQLDVGIRELARTFQYPKNYFYIDRSLVLLFGLCTALDPHSNPVEIGFPYAMRFVFTEMADQAGALQAGVGGAVASAGPPRPGET